MEGIVGDSTNTVNTWQVTAANINTALKDHFDAMAYDGADIN